MTPKNTILVDQTLQVELQDRLLALNFHAFLMVVARLLERMGYEDLALSGRTGWVGRNSDGGYDLRATVPVPGGKRRVVIQAKQFAPERRVYRRSVDELRGVCLRAGASEALLITTSGFSDSVPRERLISAPIIPVRLVDGEELLNLIALHRVGVWEELGASADVPVQRGIDGAFFERMERAFPGIARPSEEDNLQLLLSFTVRPRCRRTGKPSSATAKAALPSRR